MYHSMVYIPIHPLSKVVFIYYILKVIFIGIWIHNDNTHLKQNKTKQASKTYCNLKGIFDFFDFWWILFRR